MLTELPYPKTPKIHISYILGVVMTKHGAASCDVAPGVDIDAVDAPGTEAGNVARHPHMVTVHLGKHNPAHNGVIV